MTDATSLTMGQQLDQARKRIEELAKTEASQLATQGLLDASQAPRIASATANSFQTAMLSSLSPAQLQAADRGRSSSPDPFAAPSSSSPSFQPSGDIQQHSRTDSLLSLASSSSMWGLLVPQTLLSDINNAPAGPEQPEAGSQQRDKGSKPSLSPRASNSSTPAAASVPASPSPGVAEAAAGAFSPPPLSSDQPLEATPTSPLMQQLSQFKEQQQIHREAGFAVPQPQSLAPQQPDDALPALPASWPPSSGVWPNSLFSSPPPLGTDQAVQQQARQGDTQLEHLRSLQNQLASLRAQQLQLQHQQQAYQQQMPFQAPTAAQQLAAQSFPDQIHTQQQQQQQQQILDVLRMSVSGEGSHTVPSSASYLQDLQTALAALQAQQQEPLGVPPRARRSLNFEPQQQQQQPLQQGHTLQEAWAQMQSPGGSVSRPSFDGGFAVPPSPHSFHQGMTSFAPGALFQVHHSELNPYETTSPIKSPATLVSLSRSPISSPGVGCSMALPSPTHHLCTLGEQQPTPPDHALPHTMAQHLLMHSPGYGTQSSPPTAQAMHQMAQQSSHSSLDLFDSAVTSPTSSLTGVPPLSHPPPPSPATQIHQLRQAQQQTPRQVLTPHQLAKLRELPMRFRALPQEVQHRVLQLCHTNPVITVRDFDEKVISKLCLLLDNYGTNEVLVMLSHLEHRMRTKQGVMKNGPGYLDVAVCSHMDMLKAQAVCPKNIRLEDYAKQVLPQPVFHELREAVNTNCWLDWDQFDQGIVQLVKKLPRDSAREKLQEISYHSFKNVDNIKGCMMSILNSRIREDRKKAT